MAYVRLPSERQLGLADLIPERQLDFLIRFLGPVVAVGLLGDATLNKVVMHHPHVVPGGSASSQQRAGRGVRG